MKSSIILATLCAAMATASTTFISVTKDAAAAVATDVPICTFDPVQGEYICPPVNTIESPIANVEASVKTTTKDNNIVTKAADCAKCDRDLAECMKHWGCWFYDCLGPCKCDVGRDDPQCLDCSAGKCY